MHKMYCYVDESGQDTKGKLFVVAVVIVARDIDYLFHFCDQAEFHSKKGKFKWGKAKKNFRLAYLKYVFTNSRLKIHIYYSVFHNTTDYDSATIESISKSIFHAKPEEKYTTLIYVDGLKKVKRLQYGSRLRQYKIPTRKVQGVTKDENNPLVRLADAIAGFVADAIEKKDIETEGLFEEARKNQYIIEV